MPRSGCWLRPAPHTRPIWPPGHLNADCSSDSFKRLLIGEDSKVLGTTLTPDYAALSDWEPKLGQSRHKKSTKARGAETKNPAPPSLGRGSYVEPQWRRWESNPRP
jgi:hypothetical protein